MSSSTNARARAQDPLNQPIDPEDYVYEVSLVGFELYSGFPHLLNREEMERYNRDPDLYAAQHFGCISVEEYREWIACDFLALCSERTKSGALCKYPNHRTEHLPPDKWRERHRLIPCTLHANKMPGVQS